MLFLELRRGIFKTDEHPDVAESLECIGYEYKILGDHQQALEHFQKVLGKKKSFQKSYPS